MSISRLVGMSQTVLYSCVDHHQCSSTSPLSSSCSRLCCGTRPDAWYGASISRATTLTRVNSASVASSLVARPLIAGWWSAECSVNDSSTVSWYARIPDTSLRFFTSTHTHAHVYRHIHTNTHIYTHTFTDTSTQSHTSTHTHIYRRVHTNTRIYTHTFTHTRLQTRPHKHTHLHTHVYRRVHTNTRIYTHTFTDMSTQTHTFTHTRLQTCPHTHTFTHTFTDMSTQTFTHTHLHTVSKNLHTPLTHRKQFRQSLAEMLLRESAIKW